MSNSLIIGNRFEIRDLEKDLLGQGGMGYVYQAYDQQSGTRVAVKALKPDVVTNQPDLVDRFLREGETLRRLNHPNIVKMITAVAEGARHYLVMEYVSGGSLRDLLDRHGRLPIPRILEIALDLADALTRAHRLEVIHRDIKPANVLLAEDGTPRLTDFGVAQVGWAGQLTEPGAVFGTVDYLSPEACQGQNIDGRTDVWSFGILLYEMLTGRPPFRDDNIGSTILSILTRPVPDLHALQPDTPIALVDLIYRMLAKERQQRIPTVRLVGADLEAILHERSAGTPATLTRAWTGYTPAEPDADRRFMTPTSWQTAVRKHNLPLQPTPFIGREHELAETSRLLADPSARLVTILGPGGMGKSRLALETAVAQLDHFADGVYFVPLAPLATPDQIVTAIADALNFSFYEGGDPQSQLLDYLRQKHLLLLLDNFEHLVEGSGLVSHIIKTAAAVKLLVTSRIRLNIQGEQLFWLAGMSLPDDNATLAESDQTAAVQLFDQSARRSQLDFALTSDNLNDVSDICRLVEGMPLAIELAAAWVAILTPAEIVAEIRQNLDFLATTTQDAPEQQRSIRAVFDYSWRLLTEREQQLFAQFSVFRNGFDRQAVQAVTGASLPELVALVHKSLLRRAPTGRYEIHELLRQYGAGKLAQLDELNQATKESHSAYYARLIEQRGQDLQGERQIAALAEIEVEAENARAAWQWAVEQNQVARLRQMVDGLCRFYNWHGRYQEGLKACQSAIESLVAGQSNSTALFLRVRILAWKETFAAYLNQPQAPDHFWASSQALLEQAGATGEDVFADQAFALLHAASQMDSEPVRAYPLVEQSLNLYQSLNDRQGIATCLVMLVKIAWQLGDYQEMQRLSQELLELCQSLHNHAAVAEAQMSIGLALLQQGRLVEGEKWIRDSITGSKATQAKLQSAIGLMNLGVSQTLSGQFSQAMTTWEECLAILSDLGVQQEIAHIQTLLGYAAKHLGHYDEAERRGQIGLRLARESGYPRIVGLSSLLLASIALVDGREGVAQTLLEESLAIYHEVEQPDERAWVLATLGLARLALGDEERAQEQIMEAIKIAVAIGAFLPLAVALPALSLLRAAQGDIEAAVEIYATAVGHPFIAQSRWFDTIAGQRLAEQSAVLPEQVLAAASERGRGRDIWATAKALL